MTSRLLLLALHGVLLAPLLGQLAVLLPVGLEDPGDLRHQGVVRVGVAQQGADREQHLDESDSGKTIIDWQVW